MLKKNISSCYDQLGMYICKQVLFLSNNPGSEKKDAKWIGVPSVSKTVDLSVLKLKLFKVLFI